MGALSSNERPPELYKIIRILPSLVALIYRMAPPRLSPSRLLPAQLHRRNHSPALSARMLQGMQQRNGTCTQPWCSAECRGSTPEALTLAGRVYNSVTRVAISAPH